MNQKVETGLLVLMLAGMVAWGCGDDEPAIVGTGALDVEIRNGTWMISQTISYLGADSCLARPDTTVDSTGVICNVSVGTAPSGVVVDCNMETSATSDSIQYICTLTTNFGICNFVITLEGDGTVNDTTFALQNIAYSRVWPRSGATQAECDLFFGSSVDPCTTLINFSGTWISADGDSLCPADAASPGFPLSDLVRSVALETLEP